MAKYILVVHSNATAGKEDAYNEWYNNIHLGEVAALPGFVAGQRYAVAGEPVAGERPLHKFLAIYELETDNPQQALAGLSDAVASGRMTMSDAIDTQDVAATLYGPISERVTA